MVKVLRDVIVKIKSMISRTIRYLVFSTLLSFSASIVLIIANFIMGVRVSIGFYMLITFLFDMALTALICIYNSHKLFVPINKPLITRLEREKVERARQNKRRREKRKSKKIS